MSSTIPSGATLPVSGAGVPGRGASMVAAAFVSRQAGARSLLLVMVTMLARSRAHGRAARRVAEGTLSITRHNRYRGVHGD